MKFDIVINNGNVVFPDRIQNTDIAIKDGSIFELGKIDPSKGKTKFDAKGLHILPGIIDSQVHFREPGMIHKEDFFTGSKAAALGGVTCVFEMPNTSPPTTNKDAILNKFERAKNRMWVDHAFFVGANEDNIDKLNILENQPGCVGIKVFMGSSTGSLLIPNDDSLLKVFKNGKRRIAVHAEDEYRLNTRYKEIKKFQGAEFHPIWRDSLTAINATKRIIKIAKECNRPLHLLHITTKEEIEILKNYKDLVTVEVTPQHLTLESPNCYNDLGTLAQMNPPIREKHHQDGLWKGIQDGIVDVIGSDHAPHNLDEKSKPWPESPSGMPGVQTILPIMLDHVYKGKLSIIKLSKMLSTTPAKIYGLKRKGEIKVSNDADLSIVDLNAQYMIKNEDMATKCGWTPFNKKITHGRPHLTIIRGNIVMREGKILGKPIGKPVEFYL